MTCITGGIVYGSIGISPGSSLTGFGPCVNTGTKDLANTAAADAQLALTAAYDSLAAMPCPSENIVSEIGGTTKPAGVYCSASSISVTGTLTLDGGGGSERDLRLQAGSTLTTRGCRPDQQCPGQQRLLPRR